MRQVFPGLVVALLTIPSALHTSINFGSRQSAIEVSGGTFDFDTNATLSKGTLRTTSSSGGITGDTGELLTCTQMRIVDKYTTTTKGMRADGKLSLYDDELELQNDDQLIVSGGQVTETINVTAAVATPAILQGSGSLAAAVNVDGTSAAVGLIARWSGELNQNITLTTAANAASLTLEDDLTFANGFCVQATSENATGKVNFGGYTMTVGGGPTGTLTIGPNNQTWDRGNLTLRGDTTVSASLNFADGSGSGDGFVVNGGGHTLTVTGALNIGVHHGFITNVTLDSYGSGPFTGGLGEWVIKDVVFKNNSELMYIKRAMLGAAYDNIFNGDSTWTSTTDIKLLSDFTLNGQMYFDDNSNNGLIDGNAHTIKFNDDSSIFKFDADLYLKNVVLRDVLTESFDNVADKDLLLSNVTWHDGGFAGTVRINPSSRVADLKHAQLSLGATGSDGLLFGGDVTWNNGVKIELLSNATLTSTWTLSGISEIDGHGNVFNLNGGVIDFDDDIYLSNIILGDVASTSFDKASGKHLYMNNVIWVDDATEGAIRVTSTTDTGGTIAPAQVLLNDTDSGNIFSTAVTWVNGARIELLKDVTMGAAWSFSENTTIVGNGRVLDFNSIAGALTIATGKTLTLSDVIIRNWGSTGDIVFGSNNATVALSNATIIMSGNVTLGANEKLNLTGPVYFATRNYTFDASAADSNNSAVSTVWYDTVLTTGGRPNVKFGSGSGITVQRRLVSSWADLTFGDDGANSPNIHVDESMWLHYDIDVSAGEPFDALGRQITFANNNAFTLRGNGHTWYMGNAPVSSDTVAVATDLITVSGHASNLIEIHDLTLDGWSEAHITDSNSLIRYCQGTVIRLNDDQTLTTSINVATDTSGETVTIDLRGNDLDLSSDTAAINIADIDATLTIKNGRLINLKDGSSAEKKIVSAGTTSTVVLQDIDLVLSGDTTLMDSNITFKGDCSITGTGDGYTLSCYYNPMTIAAGACLRVGQGVTLALHGNGVKVDSSITFGSRNATLFIDGGTFDVSNLDAEPTFIHGTIRIDHLATFTGDMTLGHATAGLALGIDLMPAASLEINSGTVTYANAT